jgi:hypothetical protein
MKIAQHKANDGTQSAPYVQEPGIGRSFDAHHSIHWTLE